MAAPMTDVSGPELVIAACAAGVIGTFPAHNAADSGELESIVSVITPLTGVPFTTGSDATLLGDVGLPQPSRIAPSAPPKIVRAAARVQNFRRVSPSQVMSCMYSS